MTKSTKQSVVIIFEVEKLSELVRDESEESVDEDDGPIQGG